MGVVGHEPDSGTDSTQRVAADITAVMFSRTRRPPPAGFIQPCLPSPAERPPPGPGWLHEIKHDGFRLMARRDPAGVRLLTHDWSGRFPLIAAAATQGTMAVNR
jgi:ATP-dependent DNA ligase